MGHQDSLNVHMMQDVALLMCECARMHLGNHGH